MSLEIDGVWKAGVWATTVWVAGVWREGAVVANAPPSVRLLTVLAENRTTVASYEARVQSVNAEDRTILVRST